MIIIYAYVVCIDSWENWSKINLSDEKGDEN